MYRTYPEQSRAAGRREDPHERRYMHGAIGPLCHELGHTLGIFGDPPAGLMRAPMVGSTASQREINMLVQLSRLPHGAQIASSGTWRAVQTPSEPFDRQSRSGRR